ncbi:MAG: DUF4142 domain-containing protein [Bryobacteraceae bacterium]
MSVVFISVALFLQAGLSPKQAPTVENRAPVPIQPAPMKYRPFPDVDRTFVIVAMQGNSAELDMARMAMQHGRANEVRGFAGKMIAEHEGMMHEMQPVLLRILAAPGPPERVSGASLLALHHLEELGPVDFDQAFAMQQIGGHLAMLTAFQTEADQGVDPELKALARKWLPSIQAHLELAVDLTQHIAGASPFKSH